MRHSELESGIVNPAIYNLGSVNIDLSYSIDHIVAPGEMESAHGGPEDTTTPSSVQSV